MPKFKITDSETGRSLIVNGDRAPTEDEAAEIFAQNPSKTSQALGAYEGATHILDNLASGAKWVANSGAVPFLPKGTGDALERLGQSIGLPSTEQATQQHKDYVASKRKQGIEPGSVGKFAAETALTLPAAALGPVSAGAVTGAVLSDARTPLGVAEDAGFGAGLGKLGDVVLSRAGNLIAPKVSQAVRYLSDRGVKMTPGQIIGGVTKKVEDKLSSVPILGDFISNAQKRSVDDFNSAAANDVLSSIGRRVPANIQPGNDMVAHVGNELSNAFDAAVKKINTVPADQQFANAIDAARTSISDLPDTILNQFDKAVDQNVKRRFSPVMGQNGQPVGLTMNGDTMQQVSSKLKQLASDYRGSQDPNQRALGAAYDQVHEALADLTARTNPQVAPELNAARTGWAKLTRLETAAQHAGAKGSPNQKSGVFTPSQLWNAVRSGDKTVRNRATARGEALMQDLATAGNEVLPNSYPDSGTVGRLLATSLLGGGLAYGADNGTISPEAAGIGLLGLGMYSRPGIALTNKLLTRNAYPAAQKLAALLSQLKSPVAVGGTALRSELAEPGQ